MEDGVDLVPAALLTALILIRLSQQVYLVLKIAQNLEMLRKQLGCGVEGWYDNLFAADAELLYGQLILHSFEGACCRRTHAID